MSYLHFVETLSHKNNLVKIDIPRERIINIGACLKTLKNFHLKKIIFLKF